MFGRRREGPRDLRIIRTARNRDAINEAAKSGFRPLLKAVKPSPSIHGMVNVYQNRVTGEIELAGHRWVPGEEYDLVLFRHTYYPYHFPEPFAAYLLPPDLNEGERVWLEDVIEDFVAMWGNDGHNLRLECCEATWSGNDFEILFDPEADAPRLVG